MKSKIDNHENEHPDGWHLVGTFNTTSADIRHYYIASSKINANEYVRIQFHLKTN